MGFVQSSLAEQIGFACLTTGSRPRDVIRWTQTEQEVAAASGMAVMRRAFEIYAKMWDS